MSAGKREADEARKCLASIPDIAGQALLQNVAESVAAHAIQITLAKAQVHATLAVYEAVRDK